MVTSLHVLNFRCFRDAELHNLKRVNLLVGDNGSGKTSLLEAIFLAAGASPELALRLRTFRGLGQIVQVTGDRTSFESLWRELFHAFDQNAPVNIELLGSDRNHTRSLRIFYQAPTELLLPLGGPETKEIKIQPEAGQVIPLVFEWKNDTGKTFTAEAKFTPEGLQLGVVQEVLPVVFFAASVVEGLPQESATRFSALSKVNRQRLLVRALHDEFPMIEDISVEMNLGAPTLYASVRSLPQKLPLGAVSAGVTRFVNLLLGIATNPNGIVLIDEVENGLYFKHLPWAWRSIMQFCQEYNVQVFVTSHNQQCIGAALETIKANEDEFSLIRSEKRNGEAKAKVISGRALASAIAEEIEIR